MPRAAVDVDMDVPRLREGSASQSLGSSGGAGAASTRGAPGGPCSCGVPWRQATHPGVRMTASSSPLRDVRAAPPSARGRSRQGPVRAPSAFLVAGHAAAARREPANRRCEPVRGRGSAGGRCGRSRPGRSGPPGTRAERPDAARRRRPGHTRASTPGSHPQGVVHVVGPVVEALVELTARSHCHRTHEEPADLQEVGGVGRRAFPPGKLRRLVAEFE